MASYRCTKCQVGMFSKCSSCRSVFIEHQENYAKGLAATSSFKIVPYNEGSSMRCLQVEFGCVMPDDDSSKGDILIRLKRTLAEISEEALTQITCDHEWEITQGPCLNGPSCCGMPMKAA